MPRTDGCVFFLVEGGWRSARSLSLWLNDRNTASILLLKGRLEREILQMIEPRPLIKIHPIERLFFKLLLWFWIIPLRFQGRLRSVIVDSPRAEKRLQSFCRWASIPLVMIRETDDNYALEAGGKAITPDAVMATGNPACA